MKLAGILLLMIFATVVSMAQESVRKQDDFYDAVNVKWLEETKIPKGYSSWNNFNILDKKVSDDLRGIVEENVKKRNTLKNGTNEQKLADFYTSVLDYENRDKEGVKPVKYLLDEVNKLSDKKDIAPLAAYLFNQNMEVFLSVYIGPDYKDSSINILYLDSAGLGMMDRDYYLEKSGKDLEIQKAYKLFLKKMFMLSGYGEDDSVKKAENVFNFESKLAFSMLKREETRNPDKIYNPYTIAKLEKEFPDFNWKAYLGNTQLLKADKIVITEPAYLKALNKAFRDEDIKVVKEYMESVILRENSSLLSREFENTAFEYSKVFSGIDEMLPDDERAFDLLNESLGELLGSIYVKEYFSEDAKNDVSSMIKEIITVYEGRIKNLSWMSDTSKKQAVKKLETMTIKVGYPDKWEDYSSIQIKNYKSGGSLYSNVKSIGDFERIKALKDLNQKVDKSRWGMTPQTINAYYNPTANEIVFPAAILQAPFYDYNASKAKNYGGIGAVIGHEITHAFDDEGSKFDEAGNLKDWWTPEDRKNYEKRTEALAKQYSRYKVGDGKINGKLTLGENIADLGGVSVALEIVKTENPDNLGEFFEAYAVIWRNLVTKERESYLIKIDPHSPGKYRVNGILTNIDDFYNVYNIKSSDEMYTRPNDRIKIW
ncbi:M13 family metallopeptidase [Sebaldella sp. S0638]|uniref:M13 family metallopeptidase n=1 Tax=Sebaldella sp. S0638 TaxID=2957809 RepID=UPI00209CD02F|nr:M13 family metallopeptidase [Sebaldella sp. S0638]MCP1223327.1 M13 family metallopeptidase [Sebaldella sp. S0638]